MPPHFLTVERIVQSTILRYGVWSFVSLVSVASIDGFVAHLKNGQVQGNGGGGQHELNAHSERKYLRKLW